VGSAGGAASSTPHGVGEHYIWTHSLTGPRAVPTLDAAERHRRAQRRTDDARQCGGQLAPVDSELIARRPEFVPHPTARNSRSSTSPRAANAVTVPCKSPGGAAPAQIVQHATPHQRGANRCDARTADK